MSTSWKRSLRVVPRGPTTATARPRSDDELLVDLAAGDNQALSSLYDHVAGLVLANVCRALHDPSWTETVVEEAFVEVWRQSDRFDPSETTATLWILDLAHQLATEQNRHDDSQVSESEAQTGWDPPVPTPPAVIDLSDPPPSERRTEPFPALQQVTGEQHA